jgi:phage-related protein
MNTATMPNTEHSPLLGGDNLYKGGNRMNMVQAVKPLLWIGSSKKDLKEMPKAVTTAFGDGLFQAQLGKHPAIGKALSGFGGARVLELIKNHKGDTFRCVYTVQFSNAIVVLHCFQKKSKRGIETPKEDMELIRSRLKLAEESYSWAPGS